MCSVSQTQVRFDSRCTIFSFCPFFDILIVRCGSGNKQLYRATQNCSLPSIKSQQRYGRSLHPRHPSPSILNVSSQSPSLSFVPSLSWLLAAVMPSSRKSLDYLPLPLLHPSNFSVNTTITRLGKQLLLAETASIISAAWCPHSLLDTPRHPPSVSPRRVRYFPNAKEILQVPNS